MPAKSGSRYPSTWAAVLVLVIAAFAPVAAATKGGSPGGPPEEKPAPGKKEPTPEEEAPASDPAPSAEASADASAPDTGPVGRYIVVLRNGADPEDVAARHARAYGAQVQHVYGSALKGYAAAVPEQRLSALRADADVQFLTPDAEIQVADQATGTGVRRINAVAKPNKGTGVSVAILDTGIETTHPDLAANIAGGVNCTGGGKRNYNDGHGHGTHVAGIVAAADNGDGTVGVAPDARLWAVRVLNDSGMGWMSWIVCGIDFVDTKSPAKGGPIKVANMSLGGSGSDDGNCGKTNGDAMHYAVCRAVADGVTFVVAAGNSGADISRSGTTFVPAAYDEVITVSALADSDGRPCGGGDSTRYGSDDTFATFSNYATSAADRAHLLAAPGVAIDSTYKGSGYATMSGTSMASPHAAGAAALYLAASPQGTPAGVLEALKALGEPPNTSFNGECGSSTSRSKGKGGGGGERSSHTDPSLRHPEPVLRADSF